MSVKFYKLVKNIFLLLLGVFFSFSLSAQGLTGTKTIDPLGSGTSNYLSLKDAIDSLNFYGVGSGGVVFNIVAGHTETAPSGGYVLTASGTSLSPIVFQKSGVGINPLITAPVGTKRANSTRQIDGIWALVGSDNVTIDGIDLIDTNTLDTTMMEYGFALFKADSSNGCQYVVIKNSTITLNRSNIISGAGVRVEGSVGIYVLSSSMDTSKVFGVSASGGSNSFNYFYSNTIQNVNYGIVLIGTAVGTSDIALADNGNSIDDNTIINFGGGGSVASAAIRTLAQYGISVTNNIINNNDGAGVNHTNTLRGIYLNTATNASATIANNTLTLHGGGTTTQISAIENASGGTGSGNIINITGNEILNSDYLTATTGIFYGIYNTASPTTVNIADNTIDSVIYSNASNTGTGVNYMIYNSGAATNVNVLGNTVRGIRRFGTSGGTTIGIYTSSGSNQTVKHNDISQLSIDGTGTGATMYGIQTSTGTVVVDSNEVYDLHILKSSATGVMYGIYNASSPTNENYNYNHVYNLSNGGNGNTWAIYAWTTAGTRNVSYNTIHDITLSGTTTSVTAVGGIWSRLSSPSIFNNKIYNITSSNLTSGILSGINLGDLSSGAAHIYNNIIGGLYTPVGNGGATDVIRGINVTSVISNTQTNISNNSIYLDATSSGTNFATSGIFVTTSSTATSGELRLRNNIIVNLSTPNGTGKAIAFRRSSTTLTNYSSLSNNNLFYAGTPSPSRTLYYDGTNADSTLTLLKTRLGSRDQASVSTSPDFASIVSSDANYLAINTAIPTQIESGGTSSAGIAFDFANNVRAGHPGFPAQTNGGGTSPDIGAREFDGTPAAPSIIFSALTPAADQCTAVSHVVTANVLPNIGTLDSVKLTYAYNGTGTSSILMSNTTGNTWSGTIPAASSPSNADVSWSISAWSSSGLFSNYSGATYSDEPLTNLNLVIVSDGGQPLCLGDSITLSATMPPQGPPVGGGATTIAGGTSNSGYGPFAQYYESQRTQYLISAQLMTDAGYVAGPLTSLSVDVTSAVSTLPFNNYTLKIGHTLESSLVSGSFLSDPLATAFGPAALSPVSTNGLKTIPFKLPFIWDGTSNILIEVCFENDPGNTGSIYTNNSAVRGSATSYTSVSGRYADNFAACGAMPANTTSGSTLPAFVFGTPINFASYSWSDGSSVVGTTASIKVSPTDTTGYTLTIFDSETGCTYTTDTFTINVSNTSMGGVVTVGAGGTFNTITEAVNAFNEVCTITSPVVFELIDTAYKAANGEVFPIVITHNPKRTATNTLTIRPAAGNSPVIYGSVATGGIIQLNGADYVTIDGSNSGTDTRDLTIQNRSTATTNMAIWIASSADRGSSFNTIKNVNINGASASTTVAGILSGSASALGGDADHPNNNNTIQNNRITRFQNGLYLRGNTNNFDHNWLITENQMGDTVNNDHLGFRGMLIGNANNFVISNNNVSGVFSTTSSTSTMNGIQLALGIDTGLVTANDVSGVRHLNTAGYGAVGMTLAIANNDAKVTLSNNFIYDIRSFGNSVATRNAAGIAVTGPGTGYQVVNNTVSVQHQPTAAASLTAALFVSGVTKAGSIDVRNNILDGRSEIGNPYAFAHTVGDSVFTHFDNNALWSNGINLANIRGTNSADIVAVRAAMPGYNSASLVEEPIYTSTTDLHIPAATLTYLESRGQTIASVATDIDGDARPGPAGSVNGGGTGYDIGADEFDGMPNFGDIVTPVVSIDSILPPVGDCNPTPHAIYVKVYDESGIDSVQIRYSIGGVDQTPVDMMDVNGGDTLYVGTIPAVPAGVEVVYSVWVKDASINGNTITTASSSYKDATLNVNAGPDVAINAGTATTLMAIKGAAFRITEFNLFNYTGGSGPSGNGSNSTWPPHLPTSMYDDNIEITNVGLGTGDLSGYRLLVETSASATPVNFTFPGGTVVPPNGVVVVNIAGAGTSSPADLIFRVVGGTYAPGSGSNMGMILKNPSNDIVDAVATNSYVFSATNAVTSADWTGTGVSSPSGIAGATLQGKDENNNTNWVTGSGATPVSIGYLNPNLQTVATAPATWTGGLLSSPVVGDTLVTPVHPTPGVYNYVATVSDSLCSFSDTVVVTVLVPTTPIAGFTTSHDTALVGFNPTVVTFTDNSQNIPDGWRWEVIPNNIEFVNGTDSSSQNPKVRFTAAGIYDVKLVVSNPAGSDSIIHMAEIEAILNYCISGATSAAGQDIGNVKIWAGIDTLLNNGSDLTPTNNVTATGTYSDFTQAILPFQVHFGPTYNFSLSHISSTTSSTSGRSIYIDFNIDGDFDDPGERVFTSGVYLAAGVNSTGSFTVPLNARTGVSRMRVVLSNSFNAPPACGTFGNGETEDYAIEIITPVGDWFPPDFTTHSIVPAGGNCLNIPHEVSIGISDTTGVDSAWVVWSINGVAQADIPMSDAVIAGIYVATIPAAPAGALVDYSFIARDLSINQNIGTANGGSYVDAAFFVTASSNADSIGLGSTANLLAQTPPNVVGNGTITNSSTGFPTPFGNYYWGAKHQFLIKASELASAGVLAGNINGITFDAAALNANPALDGFQIKIGSTAKNSLSSFETGLTGVYTNGSYTPVQGINTFTFNTPYSWDGVSNIIIETCFNNPGYVSNGNVSVNQTATSYRSSVWRIEDDLTVCTGAAEDSALQRPNIGILTSGSVTYSWTQTSGGGLSATNISNPTATPSAVGNYTYTVTVDNGVCSYTDSVSLKVIHVVTPVARFKASANTALANTTAVLFTDTSANLPTDWEWNFTPNTVTYLNGTSSASRHPEVTFDAAGIYSVELIVSNFAGADTLLKPDYVYVLNQYCPATSNNAGDTDIGKVTVGSFSDGDSLPTNNNPAATGTYGDRTHLTGVYAQKMVPQNIIVSLITSGATYYNGTVNVFIDYNQNGVFDLPEERAFKGPFLNNAASRVVAGTFTAPITALTGKTLMRVHAWESGAVDFSPCANSGYGEVLDYVIEILPAPPGDWYGPDFANASITPAGGDCNPVNHTVSVEITDTTGVATAAVVWSIDGVSQTDIVMTNVGNVYSATIPAAGTRSVGYSFIAVDNSVNTNSSLYPGGTYKDAVLKSRLKVNADGYIGVGGNYQLNAFVESKIGNSATAHGATVTTGAPYASYYGNGRQQYLILASELNAMGFQAGNLSSLAFDVAVAGTGSGATLNGYTIKLANTTQVNLSAFDVTPTTVVWGPVNYTPTIGANIHSFSAPFSWDGTSNLLVEVCFSNGITGTSGMANTVYQTTTSFVSNALYRIDGSVGDVCASTTLSTTASVRPNMSFTQAGSLTYNWAQSTGGGLSATNIANPTATPTGGLGTYEYIVTVNDGTCNAMDTVLVHVVPPPTVDIGPATGIICGTSPRILDAGNPGATYAWTHNGSAFGITQTVSATDAGTYIVVVTNQAGLTGTDTVDLTVGAPFTISLNDRDLCEGGSIVLDAGVHNAYLWSTGETTQTITVDTAGDYTVTVTNADGCTATDNIVVTIVPPSTVDLGSDQITCSSAPVVLDAGNPGSAYEWQHDGAVVGSGQTYDAGVSGEYTVTVITPTGCTLYDTVNITNLPAPAVDLGADQEICPGSSVMFDAGTDGVSYLWSTGATTQMISVTDAGTYGVTVTGSNGCETTDSVVVSFKPAPVVDLGPSQAICVNEPITLDAGTDGVSYLWSTGATTQTIEVGLAGTYYVDVTGTNGCVTRDQIVITNKVQPDASFSIDSTDNVMWVVKFSANSVVAGQLYSWNFGDPGSGSANTSALPNPTHNYNTPGTYTITLTITNVASGCVSVSTQTIIVLGVESKQAATFKLGAKPNPFMGETTITYDLPISANVSIEVYDMMGRKVSTLLSNELQASGTHEIGYQNEDYLSANGMYMIRLIVDGKGAMIRVVDLSNKR